MQQRTVQQSPLRRRHPDHCPGYSATSDGRAARPAAPRCPNRTGCPYPRYTYQPSCPSSAVQTEPNGSSPYTCLVTGAGLRLTNPPLGTEGRTAQL